METKSDYVADVFTYEEFRENTAWILAMVEEGKLVAITDDGKIIAVLISPEEAELLEIVSQGWKNSGS